MRNAKRKQRIDPVIRQARLILPSAQVRKGDFGLVDVSNHSEADQRHMVRSGEKRTVRRLSHIEKLVSRKIISPRQAIICQWYADQHEKGYVATCHISNYGGAGGSRPGTMDLLAKTRDQYLARQFYHTAKSSIHPSLVNLFERVVLNQIDLGDGETWRRKSALKFTFRLAVDQLDQACGHLAGGE